MAEQVIQSRDIKLSDVFQAFYLVPDYQREYVWETKEVEQLLSDINAERTSNKSQDPRKAPEYFIGSIVVCPGSNGVLELIDGQQRMTTLFLTLCVIRDRFKELGQNPPAALEHQIASTSIDAAGVDHFRYRIDLQYEDSGGVLKHIVEGTLDSSEDKNTRSTTNLRNAYTVTGTSLKQELGDDSGDLRAFYGYLINKVKLIRIQTEHVAKALKIFETVNDRGVGLDSMDLLKNLLFMKASRTDFDKLKNRWKELQDVIFKMREKPLRFLRYFILSRYNVDALREDEIYGWFSKNESLCGYAIDPLGFAEELVLAAKAYSHFLNGRDQNSIENRYLENLRLLGGRAARQHLILLLAGRHLPARLFDRLALGVEELFFVYVITREPTRYFERSFARWAVDLHKIQNASGLEKFISHRFVHAKVALSARFDDALRRLVVGSVQKYRLRYILAKLTQYIEVKAHGETEGTKWLRQYTTSPFEIEHIFPQDPCPEAVAEFGEFSASPGEPPVSDRLGNLVLVEKSINASLGNRPYSEKRKIYPQSQLLLTKALPERISIGSNTSIDRAVEDLDPYPEWNEAAVIKRQGMLAALARSVWHLPSPSTGGGGG